MAEAARYSAPVDGLGHRKIDHLLVERLDPQRIAAQQPPGQRVVDMRLDQFRAIEGFAKADDPGIGMNADPKDVRKFVGPQGLESA